MVDTAVAAERSRGVSDPRLFQEHKLYAAAVLWRVHKVHQCTIPGVHCVFFTVLRGPGSFRNVTARVGSGRIGSVRFGLGRFQTLTGRVGSPLPDPPRLDLTREVGFDP